MAQDDAFRCIGRVLKPHGVRGEFIVYLESDFPKWLSKQKTLYVQSKDGMVPWPVTSARFNGEKLMFGVEPIKSRDDVEAHRGVDLFLPEAVAQNVARDPDYFYNSDLVGLRMRQHEGDDDYGEIIAVIEMPHQNLLEVKRDDGGAFLFPFVKDLVHEVNRDSGEMRVTMPEGLITCND